MAAQPAAGDVVVADCSPEDPTAELRARFPEHPGARAILRVRLTRISDSCGYAVPRYEYVEERDTLARWTESKGAERLTRYRQEKNAYSLDGLPGLEADD